MLCEASFLRVLVDIVAGVSDNCETKKTNKHIKQIKQLGALSKC